MAAAHRCVAGLQAELDRMILDDARLLVSELVTNSIRHAGLAEEDWIDLEIDVDDRTMRVAVTDPGPGFDPDAIPLAGPPEAPGWGLLFLRKIAPRWGVERDGRTRVWFELDLPPVGSRPFLGGQGGRFAPGSPG